MDFNSADWAEMAKSFTNAVEDTLTMRVGSKYKRGIPYEVAMILVSGAYMAGARAALKIANEVDEK